MLWACEINSLREYLSSSRKAYEAFFDEEQDVPHNDILDVQGDVAVISIRGVLSPNGPNWVERFFGIEGTSYQDIVAAAELVRNDKGISNVVLDMDTPGGTVAGVEEAHSAISDLATEKPVIAINRGMIASAGYWLASAADKILAASDVAETGSLGVVMTVWNDDDKTVDIVSKNAPLKRPNVNDPEGREEIQRRVDAIENVFFARVAEGRGVSTEYVEQNYGRGGLLIAHDPKGKDAISVGLIDGMVRSTKQGLSSAGGPRTKEVSMEARLKELESALAAVTAERDALKARINASEKFLVADGYPSAIRKLALEVLRGEEEPGTLRGAVVVFDAQKEQVAVAAAAVESGSAPEASAAPAGGSPAQDGTISTFADYERALKLARQAAGRE